MAQNKPVTPDHLPPKDKPGYLKTALVLSPLCSVALLFFAMLQLGIGTDGIGGWIKIGVISAAAFVVSYTVYRMAIEKSAPQSILGYRSSMITGGLSILLVGLTFFIATSLGLIKVPSEELVLQDHKTAVVAYVDAREAQAAKATRLIPVLDTIAADLGDKLVCEVESSCVSNRGQGGYGPTARILETSLGRAESIVREATSGLDARAALLSDLDRLIAQMDQVLADETRSIWDRRKDLRKLDGALGRALNALDEAVPVALMAAYAGELRAGVVLPDAQVSARINGILAGYAGAIDAVLGGIGGKAIIRPVFPPKVGALQAFKFALTFAPVILIAFLVDLVFPLALWIYTLNALDWAAFSKNPSRKRPARVRSDFDDLTEYQVMEPPKRLNGMADPRPARRPKSHNRRR